MFSIHRYAALTLLVVILSSVSLTFAQTAEPDATAETDDARAVLLSAMHSLMSDSYHYSSESQITSTYTGVSETQTVVNVTTADGDVAPQGDSHMTITSAGAESLDAIKTGPRAGFERIVADGEVYLRVTDDVKQVVEMDVDPGWYRLNTLLEKLDNNALRLGIENLSQIAMPAKLLVDDRFVLDVTEAEPETVDGVEARVFDVRLDGKGLAVAQMPGTPSEKLAEMFKNRALYAASTYDYVARVWINRETGKLLKLHMDSHMALPYLTVATSTGTSGGLSYDIDMVVSRDVTLSHYGEPVEIEAPATIQS